MKIYLDRSGLYFEFPFDAETNTVLKSNLPVRWLRGTKRWKCNLSDWACWQATKLFPDADIDKQVVKLARKAEKMHSFSTNMSYKDLMPFQNISVAFALAKDCRAILGDEMGLGKTVEALTVIRLQKFTKVLAVVPSSVKYKWGREVDRWTTLDHHVISSSKDPIPDDGVVIMSYDIMRRRVDELILYEWDMLIFDEAHRLKGRKGDVQRVDAATALINLTPSYLFLTGTPFLNRPIELFNMLHWLNPVEWSSRSAFGDRYCGGLMHHYRGHSNTDELSFRLKQYMVRHLKQDVLQELPPITRTIVPIDLPDMDKYLAVEAEVYAAIRELNPDHKGYYVNALDKLNSLRHALGKLKAKACLGWIEDFMEDTDEKLVVYCHHKSVAGLLAKALKEYSPALITGDVGDRQRDAEITSYQRDPLVRIAIITSAGGEGIDLFGIDGLRSSTILFVERQWTPAVEEQAEARLHRKGQTYPVFAYYPVARDTVDVSMNKMIERKRKLGGDIMDVADITTTIVPDLIGEIAK